MTSTSGTVGGERGPLNVAVKWATEPGRLDLLARLAWILVFSGVFAAISPTFLTEGNIVNVLRQTALLFLIASGVTLVIITGGIDLSVGANLGFSACLAAIVMKATGSISLAMLAAIAAGTAIGLLNGLLVTLVNLPPFIATYGTHWMILGATYKLTGGESIYGFPAEFRWLGIGYLFEIPVPIFLMFVFVAIGGLSLYRTRWGQEVYALGANPEAAYLSGIRVSLRRIQVYMLSGAMAGLAALVFLARVNSAEGDIGESLTLPAITAVLIGGASLFGGVGTITGTFVGALILTLIINAMNLLSIQSSWQPLVTGVIIVIAVLMDRLSNART